MEKYDFPINIEVGEKLNYWLRGRVQCWTLKTSVGFQIQFPTTCNAKQCSIHCILLCKLEFSVAH